MAQISHNVVIFVNTFDTSYQFPMDSADVVKLLRSEFDNGSRSIAFLVFNYYYRRQLGIQVRSDGMHTAS